jgi:hypothetical protein
MKFPSANSGSSTSIFGTRVSRLPTRARSCDLANSAPKQKRGRHRRTRHADSSAETDGSRGAVEHRLVTGCRSNMRAIWWPPSEARVARLNDFAPEHVRRDVDVDGAFV